MLWWGHPEDALAVAISSLCHAICCRGSGGSCAAWLLGVGFAFQPLIGLAIPVVILSAGWRRLPVARTPGTGAGGGAAAGAVRFGLVRIHIGRWSFNRCFRTLSATPVWLRFAPHIANETWMGGTIGGWRSNPIDVGRTSRWELGCGSCVRDRPPETLVWCVALVLALRFLFEAGVAPYYVWPPLGVATCLWSGCSRGGDCL